MTEKKGNSFLFGKSTIRIHSSNGKNTGQMGRSIPWKEITDPDNARKFDEVMRKNKIIKK